MNSKPNFVFPDFNIHSTPLMILVLQGLIFTVLLLFRFHKKRNITDLILALILLTACYQRTTYTIGFMAWYDNFKNTKINYFLCPMGLLFGPLLYFYVKSIIRVKWSFSKKDVWHFIPFAVYFVYRFVIYAYDAMQDGFAETQNGALMQSWNDGIVGAIFELFIKISMLLYIAFTIQSYSNYRKKIKQFYSNAYNLEINWLGIFLFIYAFLYLYGLIQMTLSNGIVEFDYRQKWWLEFLSALAIIVVGIKGYFTPTEKLQELSFETIIPFNKDQSSKSELPENNRTEILRSYMNDHHPYLESDLTLSQLAKNMGKNTAELSELINNGTGMNFNDFVNSYRIKAFIKMLEEGRQDQKSLVGIAYDCGFNSKATFNRVFKKFEGKSPTEFIKSNNI